MRNPIGPEKPIEQERYMLEGDTGSVVADGNNELLPSDRDLNRSFRVFRCMPHDVGEEVVHNLTKSVTIGSYRWNLIIDQNLETVIFCPLPTFDGASH